MTDDTTVERRPAIEVAPVAVLIIIALLLFAKPLIYGEVLLFRDHFDYFQPLRFFTATEMKRGHLPLWNPYNASGEPWLANPQTGVFYPPAWMFVVLPFARAYTLFLALHVALLGCGAFFLFRRFASKAGAFIAALSLMICGPSLSLLDVSNTLTTLSWIPVVLWCAVSMAPPAACAAAIAMSFLAGEPFFAAAGALMFVCIRRKNVVDIALTSIALCAVQLVPFLAFTRESDRAGGFAAGEILRHSMAMADWVRVVVPPALAPGTPHQQFVPVVYVGLLCVILAIAGAFSRGARQRPYVYASLALLIVSALVAAGSNFPPSRFGLTHLPLTVLRYPARMIPLAALALCALAAIGWDALARVFRYRWLTIAAASIVLIDLTPVIAPLLRSAPFDPHPGPYAPVIARDGKLIRLMSESTERAAFDRRAWISGYLNLFERRFDAWTAAPSVSRAYVKTYSEAVARRDRFDVLPVKWAITDRLVRDLDLIARWREVLLYRNPAARALAYWRGDDGRIVPADFLAFTTSSVHITMTAPADGTLVVTQQNARGWLVEVDGRRAEPVNEGIFRSVRVAKGRHAILWRYRPTSFIVGAILTIGGVLRMLLSIIFVKKRATENLFFDRS